MKAKLPPSGLQMTWVQVNIAFGKFEKADMNGLKETRIEKNNIIDVPFLFEKETLRLRLAFNEGGEIIGLFIQPISPQNNQ
jgi:hypothetical protein